MGRFPVIRVPPLALALCSMLSIAAPSHGMDLDCVRDPRARDREPALFEKIGDKALRTQGTLRLVTAQGSVELTDSRCENGPVDHCRGYGLVDWIPEQEMFVVHIQYWEGDAYLLVDARTGADVQLQGYPRLSPNRAEFVTVSGEESDYNWNGIEVWRFAANGPQQEWRHEITDRWPHPSYHCFRGWREPDRIWLTATRYVEQDMTTNDGRLLAVMKPVAEPSSLTRTDRGWQLNVERR